MQDTNTRDSKDVPRDSVTAREHLLKLRLAAEQKRKLPGRTIEPRGSWDGRIPLSHAQERLWFLDQIGLVGSAYNMPMALTLDGNLDVSALELSFNELIRRHETLRTHFDVEDGVPHQIIDPPGHLEFHELDLTHLADSQEQAQRFQECVRQEQFHKFDLRKGPLFRVNLLKLKPRVHVLLITMHHIVSDGWSLGILNRELGVLYGSYSQGAVSPLPTLEVQYADYAIWQRGWLQGEVLQKQVRYWGERLLGAPTHLQLPTDRPRPAAESFKGATRKFDLTTTLSTALKDLGVRQGATTFMVFLAAYQVLLSRWSGQQDIVIGSPIAGRRINELEGLIGFFVNALVLRTKISENETFLQLLARVKEETLDAYAHQDLPFETLVKELRPERSLAQQPLFQVALAMQNYPEGSLELAGLTWSRSDADWLTTHFDLTLYIYEDSERFSAVFEYATDLFDVETIERLAGHLFVMLEGIVANPDSVIHRLPLMTHDEENHLLVQWNQTEAPYPSGQCIHERFTEQAAWTPEAIAVIYEDRHLTYRELEERSNKLGHYFHSFGAGPEIIVGLCMERSLELIIGLLGILKAGAAYLPLDPSYPQERLRFMLEDSKSSLLLTQKELIDGLTGSSVRTILLQEVWETIDRLPKSPPRTGASSENLAYLIYTSGSTGVPKAVGISHESLCNNMTSMIDRYAFTPQDTILQKSSLSFDASVWEVFTALLSGARLLLAPPDGLKDSTYLCRLTTKMGVTVFLMVPSMLQLMVSDPNFEACKSLKQVFSGGEQLTTELKNQVFTRSNVRLHNLYGPTETCILTVAHSCVPDDDKGSAGGVPIGRPVWNTQTYVLNPRMQPVPIGVAGELYIAGIQLGRGYLNRTNITVERFIANPFGPPGSRMYRTGDMVRYLSDGTLEFLGRIDTQVKIRGYRIELGEIESALLQYAGIRQVAVISPEDVQSERRLVAYVVADRDKSTVSSDHSSDDLRNEVVDEWETLYDETYGLQSLSGPSFVGWNSSYTGQPIADVEMREWRDCTIKRIQALKPKRMLEIGCGLGLLLEHLAQDCTVYVGTDIAASALDQLNRWMKTRPDLAHVQLLQRSATQLQDLNTNSFDTIVMNSVVQYFPDMDYLVTVLQEAVRLLSPGGSIFLGDIRDRRLLQMFHTAVQVTKATPSATVGHLRRRIAQAMAQDKELVIDPQFFKVLPGRLRGISAAEVQLKHGRSENELTRYRYDVVLRVGPHVEACSSCQIVDWTEAVGSLAELDVALAQRRWNAVILRSVPNLRLTGEAAAQVLIEISPEQMIADSLRRKLIEQGRVGIDPDQLWELGERHGYDVLVNPDERGFLEVQLLSQTESNQITRTIPVPTTEVQRPWNEYANDPLDSGFKQLLISRLRDYLADRLPEYMIPSAWFVLKELPVSPSGKLDRRALPAPQTRTDDLGEYMAPRNEMERALAEIWAQVLRVDQVGIQDDFFDLGGHSLLVVKALFRINHAFGCTLEVTDVYKHPTVQELAGRISGSISQDDDQFVDLQREATLEATITPIPAMPRASNHAILLTGATGFLGRFLLNQLLNDTDANVYCLVRAASHQDASTRLRSALAKWDLDTEHSRRRVIAIPGDLRSPRLGLNDVTYNALARDLGSLYHCATSMNHLETYAMAKPANVDGARELLALATQTTLKSVNYVSTLGVFRPHGNGTSRAVTELSSIDEEKHPTAGGYLASKWVAERIFMTAQERGIPCNIFRVGLVWADTQEGRHDELQREYRILKSCLLSGVGIKNFTHALPPTPVDYVARALVFLSQQHREGGGAFHISSSKYVTNVFERYNELFGTALKLVPLIDWLHEIKRLHNQGFELPVAPLVDSLLAATNPEHTAEKGRIAFDCTRTNSELEHAGIISPVVDDGALELSLNSMLLRDPELQGVAESKLHWALPSTKRSSG